MNPETPTPIPYLTNALSTFLVTQFPATLGNLELHSKLLQFEDMEVELESVRQKNYELRQRLEDKTKECVVLKDTLSIANDCEASLKKQLLEAEEEIKSLRQSNQLRDDAAFNKSGL